MRRCSQVTRALQCQRKYCGSTLGGQIQQIQTLGSDSIDCFRNEAFQPSVPRKLPHGSLRFPAQEKWFINAKSSSKHLWLNTDYFKPFGECIIPLELIHTSKVESGETFQTLQSPLKDFIKWTQEVGRDTSIQLYVAQAFLSDLPQALRDDVPTPHIVHQAGKGDVYATSLWMGIAPTYTPLHKDPNPNLFAQLAGEKTVRLCSPEAGAEIFNTAQKLLNRNASSSIRGEEMMIGEERRLLEEVVWNMSQNISGIHKHFYETSLDRGDALFIPKGWWHSVKGKGDGINVSVNWWFR